MIENRLHRRHPLVQIVMDNGIYVLIALVMWQLPNWLGDFFDRPVNDLSTRDVRGNVALSWMAVAIDLYIVAILAMSYNLLFGFAGVLSFGHALFWGIGVYGVIVSVIRFSLDLPTAIGFSLGVATIFGLLSALAAYRIKGVYFAMFTLALAQIFFELSRVNMFRYLTNGDDGLRFTGDQTPAISLTVNRNDLYYVSAAAAAFTFLLIRRVMNSPTGKVILAIRDNEERTQTMGYNIYRYKALVIVIGSVLGTVAGVLHALSSKGADPGALGASRTISPLIATIIGGVGTNPGPVLGVAVLELGETFFSKSALSVRLNFTLFEFNRVVDTKSEWGLLLGIVFIIIVMAIPYGLIGQINRVWIQSRRWGRRHFYDRLVRRNPHLAAWMEPFTGEPPALAQTLAQQSKDTSLLRWALNYPTAAIYAALAVLTAAGAGIDWDLNTGLSIFLTGWLVTLPLVAYAWIRHHRNMLKDRAREFVLRSGLQRS